MDAQASIWCTVMHFLKYAHPGLLKNGLQERNPSLHFFFGGESGNDFLAGSKQGQIGQIPAIEREKNQRIVGRKSSITNYRQGR